MPPGLASEAVNQNDVIDDRVTRAAWICYLCDQEKEVWGNCPWLPRTGRPCRAQRPESLWLNSTIAGNTSTASACRDAAPSAGRTWAPGSWRKHLLASPIRLPMGIKKNVHSSSGQLKGRFLGTVFFTCYIQLCKLSFCVVVTKNLLQWEWNVVDNSFQFFWHLILKCRPICFIEIDGVHTSLER